MTGKAGQLLIVVLFIGSGCTAHRANVDQVAHGVSLHGFFGSTGDVDQVRELIPAPGEKTPLPPFWDRDVPMEEFRGKHKPLYLDHNSFSGADDQCIKGLECSTLAFYSGHGAIDRWDVPSDRVLLNQVIVGDGLLRYFWLHSCNVLAHGPPDAQGDYPQPHRWSGSSGDADVFDRWTHAFRPDLRMVCGGSTLLGFVHAGEIWDHLFGAERSVPDAFVLGVAQSKPKQVPVCLARGGPHPASSALADLTLHPEGVTHTGPNWLHLQMPVTCKVERQGSTLRVQCGGPAPPPAAADKPAAAEIETLPVVTTTALPPPSPPEERRLPLGFEPLSEDSKYHPDSGAIVLIKRDDRYAALGQCGEETKWTVNPWALLEQSHLDPGLLPSSSPNAHGPRKFSDMGVTALEMRVESRQDGAPVKERKCWLRSLFLRFDTEVDTGTQSFPIFGPGITFELQRGTPVLASFSAPHRDLAFSTEPPVPIKPAETAIGEAQEELQLDPEMYPISAARAVLGYEEAPLRCRQKFLRPTYEIRFVPTPAAAPDHPTVIVRRDARLNTSTPSWVCQGWDDEGSLTQR